MFQFEIERVDFLPAANIWCLTGKLLSGEIYHHSTALIETETGTHKIKIETVAFIDSLKFDGNKRLTLTVQNGDKVLEKFIGKVITSKPRRLATV
ncbi:MAG: hypothetical protein LH472_03110 [Pyrinomonadaceae bacterium]|nr:hypothetical protein [Pyrinomonadaceae bacterium]